MSDQPTAPDKSALRKRMRDQRRAFVQSLSEAERIAAEEALADHLEGLISRASTVGLYVATRYELSLKAVEKRLDAKRKIFAFPRMHDDGAGFDFRLGPCDELGPHQIPQPNADAAGVTPDLILVPLIAVDSAGTRLGQGGGHYDRSLTTFPNAILIGIGWAIQRDAGIFPREAWDIPLDGFASDTGLEFFRS